MDISHLNDKTEFRKSRKVGNSVKKQQSKPKSKSKFKRPSNISEGQKDKLGNNPFLKDCEFPVSMSYDRFLSSNVNDRKNSKSLFSANTDEINAIKSGDFIPFFIEASYLRLYFGGNKGFRNTIFHLSSCSHTLLFYIFFNLKYGSDYVMINRQYIVDSKRILSKDLYYKARKELLNAKVIAPTKIDDHYWVNVQLFFVGNRPSYFPEYANSSQDGDFVAMKAKFQDRVTKYFDKRSRQPNKELTPLEPLMPLMEEELTF